MSDTAAAGSPADTEILVEAFISGKEPEGGLPVIPEHPDQVPPDAPPPLGPDAAPVVDDPVAEAAAEVKAEAEAKGKPVKKKARKKKGKPLQKKEGVKPVGRPPGVENTQGYQDAIKRQTDYFQRLCASMVSMPAKALADKGGKGSHWNMDPKEIEALEAVSADYMTYRVQAKIDGPRIFDWTFFGTLVMVYVPRILFSFKLWTEQRKAAKNADVHPGNRGDGQVVQSPAAIAPPPAGGDSGPQAGAPGPDGVPVAK